MRILNAKKLKHWLWCITQTAKLEELPYQPVEREPMSYRQRDEASEERLAEKRRAK